MAYEIGVADNTFDLYNRLRSFMTTVNGWQMWSNIDGYDGYDIVYYSKGSDGLRDIYIRQRARLSEKYLKGFDQFDYGNSDTGYINFFTYAHFPQNGDAYAGSSECGRLGPRLYLVSGGATNNIWYQDMLSQQIGGGTYGSEGTGTSFGVVSASARIRRRWNKMADMHIASDNLNGPDDEYVAFDGKRYMYYISNQVSPKEVKRYSLERFGGSNSGIKRATSYDECGDVITTYTTGDMHSMICAEDRQYRIPYIYVAAESSSPAAPGYFRINLNTNVRETLNSPNWPSRTSGVTSSTTQNSAMAWDGSDKIYVVRGGLPDGAYMASSPDWGMYSISTNTWVHTQSPADPAFPDIPVYVPGSPSSGGTELLFVHNDISNIGYHRLYLNAAHTLYYINLDIGTGMPNGTWVNAGSINFGYSMHNLFFANRSGRIFISGATTSAVEHPSNTGSLSRRELCWADIRSSGTHSFNTADISYFPEGGPSTYHGRSMHYMDGYVARARTTIGGETKYVFIGDEDRIIVATKSALDGYSTYTSNGIWAMSYMGMINSNRGQLPIAELEEPVAAGVSRVLRITNKNGTFVPYNKYTIINTVEEANTSHHSIEGGHRRFVNSEMVVVTHVADNYLVATIRNDYPAGSKIGIDPQPVGVAVPELYLFQSTNVGNTLYDDMSGSDDPSAQVYHLYMNEESITTQSVFAGNYSGKKSVALWPIHLVNNTWQSDSYSYLGPHYAKESRGYLYGVYGLSNSTGIDVENTISVNGDAYYVIFIPGTQNRICIGPLK